MKNVLRFGLIAIVLVQFASCTSNNAIESELFYKSFGLNKTILSVKVTTYEAKAKFDEVVKGNPLTDLESENYIATFNNDEFVKEMNYFDNEAEEIYSKYIYSYDDKHRVIELKGYDADGKITHKRHNTYGDEEYTMVDLFYFNEKESENKTVYQLDGNYEREWKCYADGELQSMGRNEYNSGKISKKTTFDKDGKVSRYIEYTYSKNCTQVLMHNAQKGDTKIKIEYNEKGLISHTFNATARTTNNWWVNDDNTDIYYEYEYDKKGNWIKRISYSGPSKQPKDIIERVIVY